MAGASSSTRSVLQEQLDKVNELTVAELLKGKDRNEGLVAALQRETEILSAQKSMQMSGEVQMRSLLCCEASLASGGALP